MTIRSLIRFASGALALCSLSQPVSAADTPASGNVNITRWAQGTVEYRVLSTGAVNGSEEWHLTVHPDGSRTIEARNRLDEAGFQRHVTHRVAADFRPLETLASYWIQGAWRGSALFAVNGPELTAVAKTPNGMLTQTLSVPEHFSFIPHPLSTNAWHGWYYDRQKLGRQTITVYDMDAVAKGVGSLLGRLYQQDIELLGQEQVTTPAGTFLTDHFKIAGGVDMYITGPDAVLVRFVWEPADRDYVLVDYASGP
jgi:hypothetical protein